MLQRLDEPVGHKNLVNELMLYYWRKKRSSNSSHQWGDEVGEKFNVYISNLMISYGQVNEVNEFRSRVNKESIDININILKPSQRGSSKVGVKPSVIRF